MKKRFLIISILITILSSLIVAQTPRRSYRTIFPVRKKPNSEQKKRLEPHPADMSKYEQFLNQPKTGIFRLLPDPGCEENVYIVKADKKCLEAIPESSFYSFREKQHTAAYLSDIRLKSNHLISDGILAQGILVMLGDVALEKVSLTVEGLDFMQNYSAQPTGTEAQKQFSELARGIKAENFLYRKVFPVDEKMTYALRVVAFKGSVYQVFRGYRYDLLDGDKRIDITVAFRVVGKNADGSVTILWKELDRRDAPKFQRAKRRKVEK